MKRSHLFVALAAIAAAGAARAEPNPVPQAVNAFGLELYRAAATGGGNWVASPYSIEEALAMTTAGAAGQTRREMGRVLRLPSGDKQIRDGFRQIDQASAGGESDSGEGFKNELSIANRLFGQSGYRFESDYLTFIRDGYGAQLEPVNFRADAAGPTVTINAWVADQTHHIFENAISPNSLSPRTRLVLVNTVYFHSAWRERAFNSRFTKERKFTLPTGEAVQVPTMFRNEHLHYLKGDGFTAVGIPYARSDCQLLIFLPDKDDGLRSLEGQLTENLFEACTRLGDENVDLYLPRFKLRPSSLELAEILQGLGMRKAFDLPARSADFSRIAEPLGEDYLYLSEIVHQAFVDVDEKGTEAAAATEVITLSAFGVSEHPKPPVVVRVDHPFIFAIQHLPDGACLFLGRMVDPR